MSICRRLMLCSSIGFLLVAGCSGGDPNQRPTQPVTVTVAYKGAPVAGATVTFISEGQEPDAAYGLTDAQGTAKMKTYAEADGAVIGKHKVIIAKQEIVNQGAAVSQDSPDYVPPGPEGTPPPVVKNLIPLKYNSPGTSGLTAEVTAAGPNEIKLELKD